jgi:hypothetical protein
MLDRIKMKRSQAQNKHDCAKCCMYTLICAPICVTELKDSKQKMLYLDNLEKILTLRMNGDSPFDDIDIPKDLLDEVKNYEEKTTNTKQSSDYYSTGTYFVGGSGCG